MLYIYYSIFIEHDICQHFQTSDVLNIYIYHRFNKWYIMYMQYSVYYIQCLMFYIGILYNIIYIIYGLLYVLYYIYIINIL
jgi:hypothetical protein